MGERVLLAEDRANLRDVFVRALQAEGYEVDAVGDGRKAIERLHEEAFAVVVTDVRMPGAEGTEVLAAARALDEPPEVVLMTAYAEVPAAVAALKAGAYDYLAKPFEPDELTRVVDRAADRWRLVRRTRHLEAVLAQTESGFLGQSAAAQNVRRWIERVGKLPVPVLMTGESGTGKEVAARELHRVYGRGEFIPVNCAAIPEPLLEAELFGAVTGPLAGAMVHRPGLFEAANGGVLFLDEIGDMPLGLQVKLNRALQDGEIRRVGSSTNERFDVRIVAATHRQLERMVNEGTFRQDLYFRLKVAELHIPPLRERRDDIALLATRFLHLSSARYGTVPRRVSPEALMALEAAEWPGNVRELRHAIESAAVMADDEQIGTSNLPEGIVSHAPIAVPGTWRAAQERAIDQAARDYFTALLKRLGGNVTKAAIEAGVERETLHRLLRRHGIDPSRFRA